MVIPAALMLSQNRVASVDLAAVPGLAVAVFRPAVLRIQAVGHHDQSQHNWRIG
jgi:hypothetical protein